MTRSTNTDSISMRLKNGLLHDAVKAGVTRHCLLDDQSKFSNPTSHRSFDRREPWHAVTRQIDHQYATYNGFYDFTVPPLVTLITGKAP
jgi:hypothetical protein